ncbi:MAG: beta strand repeat-containing protein, partial [Cytophagales bacterium]
MNFASKPSLAIADGNANLAPTPYANPFKNIFQTRGRFVAIILVMMCLLLVEKGWGQSIVEYSFPASNSLVANFIATNLTSSNVSLSSGTIESNITTGTYFPNEPYVEETGGWTATSQSTSKNFQFNINAISGFTFSITNISFRAYATSAGPSAFGFGIGATDIYTVNAPDGTLVTVNQSVVGQTGLTTATIKIQGWLNGFRTSSGAGAFRLDDLVITGTVTPISSCTPPTVSATGFNSTISGQNAINIAWTNPGAGYDGVIVVANSTSGINPTSGVGYAANSIYGSGFSLGSGNFVVYTGTGNNVSVTGLAAGTLYNFAVYTYSSTGICYNTTNVLTGTGVTSSAGGSSSTDYFRSRQNGDWGSASTWESSADNSIWINATLTPSSTANNILIQSGHIVTISSSISIDQTTIQSGGFIEHNGGTLTINNGTNDDLVVIGTFRAVGQTATFNTSATLKIQTGGILEILNNGNSPTNYANDNGSIQSNVIWDNGSIFNFNDGSTLPTTSGRIYFPNVNSSTVPVFRISNRNAGFTLGGNSNTLINGILEANIDLTWQNSGAKTFRNGIIGIGNVTQNSTSGQFIISGTTATIGGTGIVTMHTNGMVANSGTYLTLSSNKTITGNATSNTFTVNGILDCGNNVLSGSSTFFLNNNATLTTSNANGVTGSSATSGSIQMSNSSNELFDDGASYVFNGTSSQSTGFAGTSTQINGARDLIIANSLGIVSLDSDVQAPGIIGVLSVPSGAVFFVPDGRNISKSSSGTISVAGILQIGDNNGFANASTANFQGFTASDINFASFATVEYNGGGQIVSTLTGYPNLLISTSGSKTPEDNIIVNGNLSVTGGVLVATTRNITVSGNWLQNSNTNFSSSAATIVLNGASATIDTQDETFQNLVVASSGTKTLLSALNCTQNVSITGGTLDVGTNTFGGGANLSMTGGSLRLAKTGVELPELSGTYNLGGGSIELYGNGIQSLKGSPTYNNLIFSNTSVTTLTSAVSLNTNASVLIQNSAILDVENNSFGGDFNPLTMTGTSKLITSGAGTKPDLADLYTLSSGTTIEFSGNASSTTIRQGPTTGGTQPHRYQNLIFSGVTTITAPANVLRVEGNITNNLSTGLFRANNGNVSLTGTNQTISGTAATDFYNLNIGNGSTVTLNSAQRLSNTLSLGTTSTLNANGNLTIVSTFTSTARVGEIPSSATITGNVNVQR